MKTRKLLSILSAAALTVTALSGSILTVNAEDFSNDTWDEESVTVGKMPGGGTRYTIESQWCITYGTNGSMKGEGQDKYLENTQSSDRYFEITLPALSSEDTADYETYDTIVLNMSTNEANQVSVDVKIGDEIVARQETFFIDDNWTITPMKLSIDKEAYSNANKDEKIKLCVTKAGSQNYCGNYQSVEFYNEDAEAEAEIAGISKPISEVVKAREITRTENPDRFGKLSDMEITSSENYPSVFGNILDYTECCDFTSGTDYYYVSVDEPGEYSFAVLAEGNAATNLKIEKVNGTELTSVDDFDIISWTKVGSCHYKGSNHTEADRDLYIHKTSEISLQNGLYKVTLSPGTGVDFYCDLIAIAGISSATAPEPEESPEFVTDCKNLGVAEGTGTNANTYATMFGIQVTNNGGEGTFNTVNASVTSNISTGSEDTNSTEKTFEQTMPVITLEKGTSIVIGAIINGLNDSNATMTATVE